MIQIAIVLLILWALGLMTANTFGGLVHLLLIIAVVLFILRAARGKSVLRRG